jgi:hypothetical protein
MTPDPGVFPSHEFSVGRGSPPADRIEKQIMPLATEYLRRPRFTLMQILLLTMLAMILPGGFPCSEGWAAERGAVKRGVDEENCLMCHKYPKMGLYTKEGRKIYYVGEDIYAHSVHSKVACRGCHADILQIPHRPDHKRVDCAMSCHIKDPFSNKEFSHARIKESLEKSLHGPKEDDTPEKRKHRPDCKYCHLNPLYHYEEDYETNMSLKRCRGCHAPKGVERAFEHMLYRMGRRTSRDPREIVDLCSSCHADNDLMKVFERTDAAAEGYKDYFHGKAVLRGWGKPANCVDCHSAHEVYKHHDPRSTVHKDNLLRTCSENPSCHPKANPNFVQAAVHVAMDSEENWILVWVNRGFVLLTMGTMSFLFLHIGMDLGRNIINNLRARRARRRERLRRILANEDQERPGDPQT